MDIRQLQYFVRIADEGSITGAAGAYTCLSRR